MELLFIFYWHNFPSIHIIKVFRYSILTKHYFLSYTKKRPSPVEAQIHQ
nr:MAG TPA: hypothetical protein [Caudoviricetes sp.]